MPQHIRKSNYYKYDWDLSGVATGQISEAQKHHPIFAEEKELSIEGPPNFSKSLNYFLFGLFPRNHEIKMSEACGSQGFRQSYVQHSLMQATVSLFSLGIYTPRTVKVWCENEKTSR